jgi:hypothetical protein
MQLNCGLAHDRTLNRTRIPERTGALHRKNFGKVAIRQILFRFAGGAQLGMWPATVPGQR